MNAPGFEILYEDGPLLSVSKPAGLLTQGPPGIDSLESRIRVYLASRDGRLPGDVYLGVPHRLDRPASGAMIFATHIRAARHLSKQFQRRLVKKLYWACVEGPVEPAAGTWRDVLWKVHGEARSAVVDPAHPAGQSAVLHYRTLGRHSFGSWLEIELETGRTHQVRIQASSRGHPVLGDDAYGSRVPFGTQYDDPRMRAIALHAHSLEFEHSLSKKVVTVTAPLRDAWTEIELVDAAGASRLTDG